MINSVNLKSFRKSESVQFFSDLVQLCLANNPELLNLSAQVNDLEKCTNKLNQNFIVETGSDLTTDLINLDQRRDRATSCLLLITEGYTNHFDKVKAAAAEVLLKTINKYGKGIARMNYQAQTSTLRNLCKELLNDPELLKLVKLLGLTEIINELVESNNAFNSRYLDRVKEEAETDEIATGELIKETIAKYRVFTAHAQAHLTLNPSEELNTLIDQVNELIERYNLVVTQRKGSSNEDE